MVITLNTKTHSSKEIAEFPFQNADVKSICYCKQRMKSKLSLSSECVETKFCKPCTSFTWHLHSWCGMVWYRTLRVNPYCCIRKAVQLLDESINRGPVWVQMHSVKQAQDVNHPVHAYVFLSAFPSYISGVHHFWVRFLRNWPFFNPTIKVVTFRLRGWCGLGVFLLPAFTHLGHERQDLLSPCNEMHVCTD